MATHQTVDILEMLDGQVFFHFQMTKILTKTSHVGMRVASSEFLSLCIRVDSCDGGMWNPCIYFENSHQTRILHRSRRSQLCHFVGI